MTTNATVGVSFSAGSVAKRILLFAINFFVLVLGLTCSILCLYQVKLMPESYDVILAAMAEANMTAPVNSPSSATSSSPQRLNRSTDNMGAIELPNAIEDNAETGNKSGQSEGQILVEQFRKKLKETSSANQSTSTIAISSSTQSPSTRTTPKKKLTTQSTELPKDFTFTMSTTPSSSQTSLSLSSKSALDSFSIESTTTSWPISTTLSTTLKPASTTKKVLDLSGILDMMLANQSGTNLPNFANSIRLVGRRKRVIRTTIRPTTTSAPYFLTPETIPPYFEQIFFLVQTSLYVTLAAGLLVFFASLLGICGGVFRVQGCLKFSVAAVVVVIMAEIATIGFIFVAHDKASNRNKNKNFDQNLQLLCDLANFCINPVMLVMVGAFLCVSVVLQIASITLASKMIDSQNPSDPEKKWRKMMQASGRTEMQLMASSGGGGGMFPFPSQMGYGNGGPYPSPMMMPNMNYFPQPFMAGHPGQRPVINIIS